MRDTYHPAPARRSSRLLTWIAYLFVIAGGAALGWCAAVLTDSYITQRLAREKLESKPSTGISTLPSVPKPHLFVEPGTPLAELSIPRLGLSTVVLEGSDEHTLRNGVGHIEYTSFPGESGNVAIAGHRDSFFRPLRNIQVGDDIMLETPGERVHYRVSSFRVVDPSEVSVVHPTPSPTLTLVTCYPFYFVGSAPNRFIVQASLAQNWSPPPRTN